MKTLSGQEIMEIVSIQQDILHDKITHYESKGELTQLCRTKYELIGLQTLYITLVKTIQKDEN